MKKISAVFTHHLVFRAVAALFVMALAMPSARSQAINPITTMSFGEVILIDESAATTLVLNVNGVVSSGSNFAEVSGSQAGVIEVTGTANSNVSITFNPITTVVNNGASLTLSDMKHDLGDTSPFPLGAGGFLSFKVGGTLTASGGSLDGAYEVNYEVIVDYI
ncbi:DUF4402 domain-containing protein [Sneathiella marina]|uniref:DUF4402 domain-containing protein n=1 Tax=Sneathiella marina TaxID=2950108 RepID=A0ABY4VY48_9PROT|nr:DUF4402 domain-containing protein [Sneathiella marina]USG59748.1 DUF4402 domain-containing protein [Sneathiella marina]